MYIQNHLQTSIYLGEKAQWKQRQMWRRLPWWPRRREGASLRRWVTCGRPSVPPRDSRHCSSCSSLQAPPSQSRWPGHLWSCCWSELTTLLESWRWWNGRRRRLAASARRLAGRWRRPLSRRCCRPGEELKEMRVERKGEKCMRIINWRIPFKNGRTKLVHPPLM